jgi:hypothetical protein
VRVIYAALVVPLLASAPARADDATCVAASERALTLWKGGQLHEARKQLAACADAGCPGEVKTECAKRIDEVNAAMPTLVFAATDAAGNDLHDVRVAMDGAPLLGSLDGRPVEIDPGPHAFRFERSGEKPVERTFVLRDGEKLRRELVMIGTPSPAPPPAPAPPSPAPPPPPNGWTTQRTFAVVAAGLGVAALGTGAVFGGLAISDQNMEKRDCSSGGCPNRAQAQEDYATGRSNATVATIAFVAGTALLAAAAVLFFTRSSTGRAATSFVLRGAR